MPLTPKEMERILLADGWYKDSQKLPLNKKGGK